jgi:hypothetical protein
MLDPATVADAAVQSLLEFALLFLNCSTPERAYISINSFGSSSTEHVTTRDITGPQNAQL